MYGVLAAAFVSRQPRSVPPSMPPSLSGITTRLSLDVAKDAVEDFGGPAAFLVSMLVSGPLSEGSGWRGTACPRLRAKLGTFRVCLVLGVTRAVWHLPLFFIDGSAPASPPRSRCTSRSTRR
ncbi:membrane protease YdiL (CAAX protease family) [Streptomyces sp. SAI-195]|uniref:CPBP family intramembrane glutamic endopeptidase n=1 Tax=unclassified Streptomyces TaxID=2593676 RepID=UPI00343140A9